MTAPTVINNRYEVGRRIGRGGMADVFIGHDRQNNRPIALKVLFPEFAIDPNFVERFRREAQAAANLNHPNIVDVFDWGKSGSTYYIAMEYVDGPTLADILRNSGQLNSKQAAEIAGEVAAALGYAHAAGLVHRDIKPANILVAKNGAVKVADFGIARAMNAPTESALTQAGAVMGTATYFSPEQAQGAQPDPRSDLYSLGVVMYEMIAGRPPFTGENPVSIAYKQVHDYPRPLNEFVVDVPRAYEAIVAKLLTKDPNIRYSTADALREDLRRFRNGEMPVALMAATSRSTSQTPTVVSPMAPGRGDRPSQQLTAVQRSQAGGPRTGTNGRQGPPRQPAGGRNGQRPPTGAVAVHRDQRAKTGWYALAAFFALVALGIGGFLLYSTLSSGNDREGQTLPDFTGQELDVVLTRLGELNLSFDDPIEDPDATNVEPGQVSRTAPAAGTILTPGLVIDVYFRPIAQREVIPELRGQTVDAARATLANLGFVNVTVQERDDSGVEPGQVIATDPAAGSDVALTDQIIVLARPGGAVATEPGDEVEVPYLIQSTQADAEAKLEAAGLEANVELVDPNLGSGDPANWVGRVMDQSPVRGETVAVGDTVTIRVGQPLPTTTRPPQTNPPATTRPPQTNPPATNPPATQAPTTQAPTTLAPTTTAPPPETTTTVPPGP